MASSRLEKLRKNITAKNEQKERRPNNYYPFFAMEFDESAIVRFLPDLNEDNPLDFVVEKVMHNLVINGERKVVPCMSMYGEDCPICAVSQAFYKEKDEDNGKKYWRKKQHIAQCLVIDDPMPADKETGETHEGKLRFLNVGFQLFNVIEETFKADDLDEVPYDYEEGCNFTIKKTKQGKNAKYDAGSRFARKTSALTKEQMAIVQEGMVDLATLIPSKPDLEKLEAMLQASLTGGDYSGGSSSGGSSAPTKAEPAPEPKAEKAEEAEEAEEATPTPAAAEEDESGDGETDDILAAIKNRRKNRA